jgi:hypothetical protein
MQIWRLILISALFPSKAALAHRENFLADYACRDSASQTLKSWQTDGEIEFSLADTPELTSGTLPTREIGAWVKVKASSSDGKIVLKRLTAESIEEVTYRPPACTPEKKVHPRKIREAGLAQAFTDAELRAFISSKKDGIIYTWSPRMPYSIDGIRAVREAAKGLGVSLLILRDPDTSLAEANSMLRKLRVMNCSDCMRPIGSLDLMMRKTTQHFPTAITFTGGQIRDGIFPGMDSSAGYISFYNRK